jgi:hypothetical protein
VHYAHCSPGMYDQRQGAQGPAATIGHWMQCGESRQSDVRTEVQLHAALYRCESGRLQCDGRHSALRDDVRTTTSDADGA